MDRCRCARIATTVTDHLGEQLALWDFVHALADVMSDGGPHGEARQTTLWNGLRVIAERATTNCSDMQDVASRLKEMLEGATGDAR